MLVHGTPFFPRSIIYTCHGFRERTNTDEIMEMSVINYRSFVLIPQSYTKGYRFVALVFVTIQVQRR